MPLLFGDIPVLHGDSSTSYQGPTTTNYAKTLTSTTIDAVPLTFLTCSRAQGIPFNRPLSILLDSGSTASWVNRNTLPSSISPTTVTSLQGTTMAGNFQSNQQLTLTSVALPTLNLHVFNSSCRYDIILGRDALALFAITIDFDTSKVIGRDSRTIPLRPFPHEANMSSFNIGIFLAMDHFEALLTECMISDNDDALTSDPPVDPYSSSSPPEKKKQKCAIKDSLYEKHDPSQIAASCTHLDIDQKQKLAKLLAKYPVLFNESVLDNIEDTEVYLDDIAAFSYNFDSHSSSLTKFFLDSRTMVFLSTHSNVNGQYKKLTF